MSQSFEALLEEIRSLSSVSSSVEDAAAANRDSCYHSASGGYADFLPASQLSAAALVPQAERVAIQQDSGEHCMETQTRGNLKGSHSHSELLLPREHMGDVGQSLPDLAVELAAAQNTHHVEVEQRQRTLQKHKAELQKEKLQLQSTERHICAAAKAICLARDEVAQTSFECDNLEKTITTLVSETQDLKSQLKQTRDAYADDHKLQCQYRERMSGHRSLTEEVEQSCPAQQQLEALRQKIADLKEKRGEYIQGDGLSILSGEKQRVLQEKIAATGAKKSALAHENVAMLKKVQAGDERIEQLKREVEMNKKRHQAQLTRLRRQLQEAQVRRRQWAEEAERLRTAVGQLRQKIEE